MVGQVWAVDTLGGYMYSDELSDTLRMQVQPLVKVRQFCDAKDFTDKGLHKGQLAHWDVYSDISNQGGTLVETSTMPESNFTVSQGTLTITEYGNSVPYTGKLDNLSAHPVREIITKVLKNDAKKAFDSAAYNEFNRTLLRYVATTATDTGTLYTNGTATGTNSVGLGKNHVKDIVDKMKERNIPPYMGDDYMSFAHPTTFRPLKNDLEAIHQYVEQGFTMILNGEIGRYEGVRFVEQTNIAKAGWTNGKSNQAFFFGEDTAAEAIAIPEEMRGKIPGDYGRSKGVAWYYLGGFGIVHLTAVNSRIVKWDSAA
jgi:N4-gp56 family major capsid protein